MPDVKLKRPKIEERRHSWLGIVFALICCMGVYGGLSFLTLGFFGPVLIVGGVAFGIALFHYFVWGWWLGKILREAADDDDS